MASNKDSKTSKTAHVMNLLSKNRNAPPAEPVSASAPASPEPAAAAPAAAAPIAPIITSINADAAVSSQIKDALEASLTPAEPPCPHSVRHAPAPGGGTGVSAGAHAHSPAAPGARRACGGTAPAGRVRAACLRQCHGGPGAGKGGEVHAGFRYVLL